MVAKDNKIKTIPKFILEELEEVRKKFKSKVNFSNNDLNKYVRNCNFLIQELNYYKKELIGDKNKRKYALNFEFPIISKKNERDKK